jgi:hypothetical protein
MTLKSKTCSASSGTVEHESSNVWNGAKVLQLKAQTRVHRLVFQSPRVNRLTAMILLFLYLLSSLLSIL